MQHKSLTSFFSSSFPHMYSHKHFRCGLIGDSSEGSKESIQRAAKHNLLGGGKKSLKELDLSSLEIRRQKRHDSSLQLCKRLLQRVGE